VVREPALGSLRSADQNIGVVDGRVSIGDYAV
jgi:hypothetical protein